MVLIAGHRLTSSPLYHIVFVGRKYNKDGDLDNWWSSSSNAAFEKKSRCFVDQYSRYEAYGQKVSYLKNWGKQEQSMYF